MQVGLQLEDYQAVILASVAISSVVLYGQLRAGAADVSGNEEVEEDNWPPEFGDADEVEGWSQYARAARTRAERIRAWKTARMMGCIASFGLSLVRLSFSEGTIASGLGMFVGPIANFYAVILSYFTLSSQPRIGTKTNPHLSAILFVLLSVCVWRNIWPLASFDGHPKDEAEGALMWVRLGVLLVTGALVPLFIPRCYVPVDPKDPMPNPNPEQTASLFSLIFYFFMDSLMFLGYRLPHLPVERLPPLSDYDRAKHLIKGAFPHLDPRLGAKKRHMFFNMMRTFRTEYITMAVMITLLVLATFLSPIGLLRILEYIENPNESSIRPWFWVLCLFCGPMGACLVDQWYSFVSTQMVCRAEAIVTQLIYDHSLRIRMKAEAGAQGTARPTSDSSLGTLTPDDDNHSSGAKVKTLGQDVQIVVVEAEEGIDSNEEEQELIGNSDSEQQREQSDAGRARGGQMNEKEKESKNMVGKINNLFTTDMDKMFGAKEFLFVVLYIPLQVVLAITFLYNILGWSSFVALAVIICMMSISGWIANKVQGVQRLVMKKTDVRIQMVSETMHVLRMVKLFGWETKMKERIMEARDAELKLIWKAKLLKFFADMINRAVPSFVMVFTYATFTLVMKQELTASKIFSSIPVFELLRGQVGRIFWYLDPIVQSKVSLERLADFLYNSELLDNFDEKATSRQHVLADETLSDKIGFRDAVFSWSKEEALSHRAHRLKVDGELFFKKGAINLITGPTGSGKTSMLMALLGEMHFTPNLPTSGYSLPRAGGVAYAAQESWIQNATIRENILFGAHFDRPRYEQVIYQCALERDLELFEAGDQTEVGERGLTLSGGQKARVTLARAVYSRAEITLLDDVLAALDVHTSQWIVDKCLQGPLLKGRTVILVAHNVALTTPLASFIVHIHGNGKISTRHQEPSAISADLLQLGESSSPSLNSKSATAVNLDQSDNGKLILAEEVKEGHVAKEAILMLLRAMSGNHLFRFIIIILFGSCLTIVLTNFQIWYLGYWGGQYEQQRSEDVNAVYYLTGYISIILLEMAAFTPNFLYYTWASLRGSRTIHAKLTNSVIGTTLRWLDSTPISRVLTRSTGDMRAVDSLIPDSIWRLLELVLATVASLGAVILYAPAFALSGFIMAMLGAYAGNIYSKSQLPVKREKSNARAPVLAHIGATLNGLTSVRAYGAQEAFRTESLKRIDRYTHISRTSYNLNRWLSTRMYFLSSLFSAGLAAYLVYGRRQSSSATTGFSLNMAIRFSSSILWVVRMYNQFEVDSNSLERIYGYTNIEQERQPTGSGKPPASWPTSGELIAEKLSAKYSATGPEVLHNLEFHVKSGERVGIVGRTGSGKSSLTLSLLQCILTEGDVHYSGLSTNRVNLDALRSNITIIPQVPEMLSGEFLGRWRAAMAYARLLQGTLRRNLDPFEQHDDTILNDALRSAGLFDLQMDMVEGKLTLDSNIASGGGNLSVGQRQIVALARAFVRGSKLLILDEATSAIDYRTDAIIQSSLRQTLGKDVTVLTIAHRLQTIMDADRIMVLDAGKIVEFDTPNNLLQNKEGFLTALVEGSMDRDTLHGMVQGGR